MTPREKAFYLLHLLKSRGFSGENAIIEIKKATGMSEQEARQVLIDAMNFDKDNYHKYGL